MVLLKSAAVWIVHIIVLIVTRVQAEAGNADFFYLRNPDAAPVKEYVSEPDEHKNVFQNVKGPKVVEFYSPLCPACNNYRPHYIKLAKETTKAFPTIQFFAVSCDKYEKVCEDFDVNDFPTIRLFNDGPDGDGGNDSKGKSISHTRLSPVRLSRALGTMGPPPASVKVQRRMADDEDEDPGDEADKSDQEEEESQEQKNDLDADEETEEKQDAVDEEETDEDATDVKDDTDKEGAEDAADEEATADDKADEENENTTEEEETAEDKVEEEKEDTTEKGDAADDNGDEGNEDEVEGGKISEDKGDDAKEAAAEEEETGKKKGDEVKESKEEETQGDIEEEELEIEEAKDGEETADEVDDEKEEKSEEDTVEKRATDVDEDEEEVDESESDAEEEEEGTETPDKAESPDEESDDEEMLPDTFKYEQNMLQQRAQISNGRRPNAGYSRARTKDKQMDRFKNTIKAERQTYLQKRKGLGQFIRHDGTRDKRGKPLEPTPPEEMTKAMKQYTPGTAEFEERRKAILDRVRKNNRKARKDASSIVLVKGSLPYKKDVRKPGLAKKAAEQIPVLKRMVKMTEEEELILDVSLSLTVGLETGVSMGIENLKARTVLRKWLDLLSVSLPPEWGIHRMIDDLRSRFAFATKSKENFKAILKEHPLPRQGWSHSCQIKRSGTGYSCGFWKLLHTVSVGVTEQRGGKNLIDSGMMVPQTTTFSPMEAADTIRDYINQFFTCRPCRVNFVENYDNCDNNRRCDRLTDNADGATTADWKELPLWLWEVHNEVSVRIVKEKIEQTYGQKGVRKQVSVKDEVKSVWPNVETCILCFNTDGTWNEGQIFRFLEKSYWPDSEVDPKHDKLLTFDDETTSGLGAMLVVTLLILWAVYSVIGKHSSSIQHSVLAARHAVSRRTGATLGGGKKRTA